MKKKLLLLITSLSSLFLSSYNFTGPPEERKWDKSFYNFGLNLQRKYDIQFMDIGISYLVEMEKEGMETISFVDRRNVTIDQARPFILSISDDVWNFLSKSADLPAKRRKDARGTPSIKEQIKLEDMGIKISFWNEDIERPLSPYLAQIKVVGGKILYFYADSETQALQEPILESLEEARQKIGSKSLIKRERKQNLG